MQIHDSNEHGAVRAALEKAAREAPSDVTPEAPRTRAGARLKLGDMLVAQGILTPDQLLSALGNQKRTGRRLGHILIEDGYSTEEAIAQAIAQQLSIPYLDLTPDKLDRKVGTLLTEAQARRLRVLPIFEKRGTLHIGMVDPSDYQASDEVQRILKRDIDLIAITESRFNAALDLLHAKSDQIVGLARELEQELGDEVDISADASGDDAPVTKLLQTLFDDASRARASDIHIEPMEKKVQIRFRVDGHLVVHTEAETRIAPAIVQKLKLASGLDIAERRLPQDGRFLTRARNLPIDMRISTMPSQYGESVVLRLLPQTAGALTLDRIGMPDTILARVRHVLNGAPGMLLVTGPTGSGKTTTLYGGLSELNSPGAKLITVEDPVEYRLPGITQVQVNEKIGLTFAAVLRSTLRQDPDVILVGEMRDKDTVETGLRAAMTGHMVLSTLHTNDSVSAPLRLLDMGAPRFLIASSLRLVIAQRLVRRICDHCRSRYLPVPQDEAFLRACGAGFDADLLMQGNGCSHCNHTGYNGRLGVYELLEMSRPVVGALTRGNDEEYLACARAQVADLSLTAHLMRLLASGATSISEARQLIGREYGDADAA